MPKPRLKACPFCGRCVSADSKENRWWQVECECGVAGPKFEMIHLAIEGWNKMCGVTPLEEMIDDLPRALQKDAH